MYNNQNPDPNYRNRNNRQRQQNVKKPAQRKNVRPPQKTRRSNAAHSNDYNYNYYGGVAANYPRRNSGGYRRRRVRVRFNVVKYIYRLLIILVFAVIIAAIIGALFYFNLTKTKKHPDIIYEFVYGEDKPKKIQADSDIALSNGEYYIPINDLMSKLDCNITGDKNEISFISAATNNFLKFKVNSPIVYVNNVEYHMTSPSILDGSDIDSEKLYVPLDFVQNKFDNLNVTQDEKNENHFIIEITDLQSFAFKLQATDNLKNPLEGVELPSLVEFVADLDRKSVV